MPRKYTFHKGILDKIHLINSCVPSWPIGFLPCRYDWELKWLSGIIEKSLGYPCRYSFFVLNYTFFLSQKNKNKILHSLYWPKCPPHNTKFKIKNICYIMFFFQYLYKMMIKMKNLSSLTLPEILTVHLIINNKMRI